MAIAEQILVSALLSQWERMWHIDKFLLEVFDSKHVSERTDKSLWDPTEIESGLDLPLPTNPSETRCKEMISISIQRVSNWLHPSNRNKFLELPCWLVWRLWNLVSHLKQWSTKTPCRHPGSNLDEYFNALLFKAKPPNESEVEF